jgi:hypothetical protein
VTLYTFPDPLADVRATLQANASRWPNADYNLTHPGALTGTVERIQYAWDGTPADEQQREFCTVRITYWTAKGKRSNAINGASLVRAVLLNSGSATVWRYTRGLGRLHGTDPDTENEFCSFTLTAETRPSAVP